MNWRRRMIQGTALAAMGLTVLNSPAPAHHSYAMFDRTQTLTVSGTVRTFQWANPHVYLWLYVDKDLYAFEFGGGPNALVRSGWSKETLKAGDKITVTYNPLKDGRTGGEFVSVVLPDGTHLDSNGAIGQDGEHRVP